MPLNNAKYQGYSLVFFWVIKEKQARGGLLLPPNTHTHTQISIKLNYKIPVVFYNSKKYDSHLIMQNLIKFNLKINVILNGLEKYMSFTIKNKSSFTDSFQFLSSSLNSFVKNLGEDYFQYLSHEFDNKVLDLVKQIGFYHYEYKRNFEKFKEKLLAKKSFIVF